MSNRSYLVLIIIGFVLLFLGMVLPFLMVIQLIESTFLLNFLVFAMSLIGLIVGMYGGAMYDRYDKTHKYEEEDFYKK